MCIDHFFEALELLGRSGTVEADLSADFREPRAHAVSRSEEASEVEITLELRGIGDGPSYSYTTKLFLPIQQPLSFGITQ